MRPPKTTESWILFVRTMSEVGPALDAVGEMLARREQREPLVALELLGVWVDGRLGEGLSTTLEPPPRDARSGEDVAAIVVQESITLAGLWTLYSVDGPSLRRAANESARRRLVLDAVAAARPMRPDAPVPQFLPSFSAAMPRAGCVDALRTLQARHPGIVGATWFQARNEIGVRRFRSERIPSGDPEARPRVAVIMGSKSDWSTMSGAAEVLKELGISYEAKVVSAHRTPDLLFDYVGTAEERGIQVIVAGAGGAAHLPGMAASKTTLPVLGVPIGTSALNGVDSLLSIVQMPRGVPVGTLAIGPAGAANAALLAASMLALGDAQLRERLKAFRARQTAAVLEQQL